MAPAVARKPAPTANSSNQRKDGSGKGCAKQPATAINSNDQQEDMDGAGCCRAVILQ
ncbi:MAG: hypothetical protein GY696_16345 [Gammaproteobacteria bacterium]|nr:hypothetical protein [Gammaproteobacteria bacterium]